MSCNYKKVLLGLNEGIWEAISGANLPVDFMLEFKEQIDWGAVEYSEVTIPYEAIKELKDFIFWDEFSPLIEDKRIIMDYKNYIDWDSFSAEIIDDSLIEYCKEKINWVDYSICNSNDFEFYLKYIDYISPVNLNRISFNTIKYSNFIKYLPYLNTSTGLMNIVFNDTSIKDFSSLTKELKESKVQFDFLLTERNFEELLRFKEDDFNLFFSPEIINSLKFKPKFNESYISDKERFINLINNLLLKDLLNVEHCFYYSPELTSFIIKNTDDIRVKKEIVKLTVSCIKRSETDLDNFKPNDLIKLNNLEEIQIPFNSIKLCGKYILNSCLNIFKYPQIFVLTEKEVNEFIEGFTGDELQLILRDLFFIRNYRKDLSKEFLKKYEDYILNVDNEEEFEENEEAISLEEINKSIRRITDSYNSLSEIEDGGESAYIGKVETVTAIIELEPDVTDKKQLETILKMKKDLIKAIKSSKLKSLSEGASEYLQMFDDSFLRD